MPYNLQSLLTIYVRMRQQGQAMASVVNQLQSAAQQLPWADRVRLNELITDWEGKYSSLIGQPLQATIAPDLSNSESSLIQSLFTL